MSIKVARLQEVLASRDLIFAEGSDVETACRMIASRCLTVLPAAHGAGVALRDQSGLMCRAAVGTMADRPAEYRLPRDRHFAALSMLAECALNCPDVELEPAVDLDVYGAVGTRSVVSVPLLRAEGPIGALTVVSTTVAAFDAADVVLVEILARELTQGLGSAVATAFEDAERESRGRFRAITEALPQLIWTMRPDGIVTYANRNGRDFWNRRAVGALWDNVGSWADPLDHELVTQIWRRGLEAGQSQESECRLIMPSGEARWFAVTLAPVAVPDQAITEWIGIGIDIHDRKGSEQSLQEAVHGKSLLLHEVNHRVKNSLQVAMGLLAIQAGHVRDPEARQRLMDARQQIITIARVHEATLAGDDHDRVALGPLFRELAKSLVGPHNAGIALGITVADDLILPLDRAVPLSLIVGELLTNALKHAMGDAGGKRIDLAVIRECGEIRLDVIDDGPGLPQDSTVQSPTGIGMELVTGLAQQLGGRFMVLPASGGAHMRIVIPS